MSTNDAVNFVRETRNSLSSLADRLASVRYDFCGPRPEPAPPPSAPTPERDFSSMSFLDIIEYLAGDINQSLNKLNDDITFLSERVNHKEVAVSKGQSASARSVL